MAMAMQGHAGAMVGSSGMEFLGGRVDKGVQRRVVVGRWRWNSAMRGSLVASEGRVGMSVGGSVTGKGRGRTASVRVGAGKADSDGVRWWEKDGGPNFNDVHSTQEFIDALSNADEKLVVVEFYASWCGSCRALYPKLCKLAAEHLDVEFMKVNFEENKPMCKSLNIRVLPFFHFYRGAEGRLDAFSCSLAKLQKIRDAIAEHNTARCSIGPPVGAGNIFSSSSPSSSSSSTDQTAAATASS